MAKVKNIAIVNTYIVEFIATNKLEIDDFCRLCNIEKDTLKKIFNFKKNFLFEDICKISRFINVSIDKLVIEVETELYDEKSAVLEQLLKND